ncbi:hypothetical protein E1B28_011073 [Marasmius oreades]|uniref:BTB domain-containing protein n=1 Tax=Marasmius oreades TaxID=181124 RepID=A0A9P7RUP5_9AGAR|nr:uncharacterized protein E1B28_011073 [Marasmius oreades]KAG7089383.1 hypothetical protein E1B28_011073 [Marasmius oreades]
MSIVAPSPPPPSECDSSDEIPDLLSPTQSSESETNEESARIYRCLFCEHPADTNICSSDGRVFGAHFSHLKQFTGGLGPLCDSPLREAGEHCQLPFDHKVAELILEFLHPKRPPPDVSELRFNVIERLAEVVEMYQVYPAMAFCRFFMETQAEAHPVAVFAYALKYDHRKLALRFLERNATNQISPEEMKVALSDRTDLFAVLMLYQYNLMAEAREIFVNPPITYHPPGGRHCALWSNFYSLVLKEHFGKEFSLVDFDDTLERLVHLVETCRFCATRVKQWREGAVRKIQERQGFWELLDKLNGKEIEIKAGKHDGHDENEMF